MTELVLKIHHEHAHPSGRHVREIVLCHVESVHNLAAALQTQHPRHPVPPATIKLASLRPPGLAA